VIRRRDLDHVDAAHKPSTGESAVGAVVRSHNGHIIAASSKITRPCQDAEEAEAMAILTGLHLCIDLGLQQVTLHSDCVAAVRASNGPFPNRSKIWSVSENIADAISRIPDCSVQHTSTKLNSMAHKLAQLAIRSGDCNLWMALVPSSIAELALCDAVNIIYE
jgi:ribonuclease HI